MLSMYPFRNRVGRDNYSFNSINDDAFFDGHFIVIIQEGVEFLFNLKSGYIYLLGNNQVERIGQIVNTKSYDGQRYIIEDLDKGQVWVSGKIIRNEKDEIFPEIRQLDMSGNIGEILKRFE